MRGSHVLLIFVVKTGRWGGVVTAFITMSDIKDEIDWEFPGAQTSEGQTNYFWQGIIRTFAPFSIFFTIFACALQLPKHTALPLATSVIHSRTTMIIR